jgi:hypothetical protein
MRSASRVVVQNYDHLAVSMPKGLDPNDWIDVDEMFPDDYGPDEITYAGFTIVPGDTTDYCSLIWWADGVNLEGGGTGCNWAISMYYGYRYNGQDIPIGDYAAEHILKNLSGKGNNWKEYDWAAQDWVYAE